MTSTLVTPSGDSSTEPQKSAGRSINRAPARRSRDVLKALPWIGPALVLILSMIVYPAGLMFFNSTRDISSSGVDRGSAGFDNFARVIGAPTFWPIMGRTFLWVVLVVGFTVIISMGLAQLLNKAFPGRRIVRALVIVPWAASVVMTTMVIYYGLEPYFGIINAFLVDIGFISQPEGYGWTRNPGSAFGWAVAVAVFVSLPFTTYTLLAGLQTIPGEVIEAAQMDGARPLRLYLAIILPQLKPALAVAVLINIINVFNSLPILRVMTGSIPGYDADTIMTMIFKYLQDQRSVHLASALSVIAFIVVLLIVAVYVKVTKPLKGVDE